MCEWRPPVATLSAGATTTASSIGPSSGTAICRGFEAVSIARRRASVSTGENRGTRLAARPGRGSARVIADIRVSPFRSRSLGELVAGELQVDVVEGGNARRDLHDARVESGQYVGRGAPVQRGGHPRPHR